MSKPLVAIIAASLLILSYFLLRSSGDNIIDSGGTSDKNAVEAFDLWKEFSPKSGEFSVSFPTEPKMTTQSALDIRTGKKKLYRIFASEQLDSSVYIVTSITFPIESPPEKDLKILENTVADLVAQGNNSILKSADETTFQGLKAVKFVIESDLNNITGITFVYNKRLYILTRFSTLDKINDKEFNQFISSFKLPKKNEGDTKQGSFNE